MNPSTKQLLAKLQRTGWKIELNKQRGSLPRQLLKRYSRLPPEVREFAESLSMAVNSDETAWLLGLPNYSGISDFAFKWNEWELLSLEAAEGNETLVRKVKTFWDAHFPIAMSVKSGYAYFALRIADGAVVFGTEPEFEEPEDCQPSFQLFLGELSNVSERFKPYI